MLDFDVHPSAARTTTTTTTVRQVQAVTATETVRVVPNRASGFLGKPTSEWNWSDLRDYIVTEVEARHGAQVRDPKKESGICKGFIARWGIEQAVAIAQAAFEVYGGMWRSSPITITRFTKNSDPYFAEIIVQNLSA